MGKKTSHSRHGSLQYWPRKRAARQHARVRNFASDKDGMAAFAGFKAGMTHIQVVDNRKNSPTKGREITMPVTLVECPPLKIIGLRAYKKNTKGYGETVATEVRLKSNSKHLSRTTTWKPTGSLEKLNADDYTRAVLVVHTQPDLAGFGQKKPQIFEVGFNGSVADAIAFAKEHQEITVDQLLKPGEFVDAHAVTTGKGYQGVVKRFGVSIRSHKSEKGNRKAVIGPEGYGKVQYTAPQAGKMGYHLRTEYNKQIMDLVQPEDIQISGGIVGFGQVKNPTLLIKGSLPGPKKRMITLVKATRQDPKASTQAMEVTHVATRSQQGNQ